MTFNLKCIGDPEKKPTIFLVDEFFTGITRFSEYPPEAREAFQSTFAGNIDRLKISTANSAPSLFRIEAKTNLDQLPAFLGSGDVVLGFAHLPPYAVNTIVSDLEIPPVSLVPRVLNRVVERFILKFESQLRIVTNLTIPEGRLRPIPPAADNSGMSDFGRTVQTITTKDGKAHKIYFSVKIGVIDVGFPTAQAVQVWPERKIQDKILKVLSQPGKGDDLNFSPKAVASVPININSQDNKESRHLKEYFQAVGRGLAYNLLHEFWHTAEEAPGHPYGLGNGIIEGTPSCTKPGLVFQNAALQNMLANYEKTWCKFIQEGRVGMGDLKA